MRKVLLQDRRWYKYNFKGSFVITTIITVKTFFFKFYISEIIGIEINLFHSSSWFGNYEQGLPSRSSLVINAVLKERYKKIPGAAV